MSHDPKSSKQALPYARVVFPSGVSELRLHGETLAKGLYRARFDGTEPGIEENDGTLTIKPSKKKRWWSWTVSELDLSLRDDLPWEIEIRGGASEVEADLSRLVLRAFDIVGGISEVNLTLGRPRGTATLRLLGGASELRITRPPGVGLRLSLKGGASSLKLDEFRFGSVGGPVRWESQEYGKALDRYDFELIGGASELTVGRT